MAGISQPTGNISTTSDSGKNHTIPLIILTSLFFMWGFITCMNDIMIPFFKKNFELTNFHAGLIQFFFFFAYFIVALSYFVISSNFGDPISKIGYKNGIIAGLIIAGIGCCMFYPAAEAQSYSIFLGAFFVLAAGITILQMAANPYVALLGSPETSSSRLNMTQAFNSLGTTIAPIVGSTLVFAETAIGASHNPLEPVKAPYIGLAVMLFLIAILISFSNLPKISGEKIEKGLGVLKFSHLTLGVIAIFMYVGGEVAIGSYMANYFEDLEGIKPEIASKFVAFYWGGAMIGRFIGALSLSENQNKAQKYLLMAFIVIATIGVVFFYIDDVIVSYNLTFVNATEVSLIILGMILLNIAAFQIGAALPGRTLGIFALVNTALILITSQSSGLIALFSVIAIGLFNSIMFPTIFTLAIKGLGKYTSQGSSLLVMAIVGGAIVTPLVGEIADVSNSYQIAYLVPVLCYVYICFYGFFGSKVKKQSAPQEVDPEKKMSPSTKDLAEA